MIEYFVLLGIFSTMFLLAFLPGYLEYRAPGDPGPLHINLSRVIESRSEAMHFRRTIEPLADSQGWRQKQQWGTLTYEKEFKNDRGSLNVLRIDGNITLPAGSAVESALIVLGDLSSGEHCGFSEMVYVKGRCQIGRHNKLVAITSVGDLSIGEGSEILSFVDSDSDVRIMDGCIIGGTVSSDKNVTLEGSSNAKRLRSQTIIMISQSSN